MKFSGVVSALVLTAAVAGSAAVAQAGTTVKLVRGNLAASTTGDKENGYFRLADVEKDGATHQNLVVFVSGLPAVQTGATAPEYDVVLTPPSTDTTTAPGSLGAMRLFWNGTRAGLHFDTRTSAGITDLAPFSGGTIHIQTGGADVATGTIPAFVVPDGASQGGTGPTGTIAFGYGQVILGDTTSSSGPVAKVAALAVNSYHGVVQAIGVAAIRLPTKATYTVTLSGAADGDPAITLGTFSTNNWWGYGQLVVTTQNGGTIPGGSVSGLAGRTVSILDSTGAVVLTGAFPSLN